MKRDLDEQEKSMNLKAITRLEKDLEPQLLTRDLLQNELDMIEKRSKLAKITKERDLATISKNVENLESNLKILKDQIVNGVEVKEPKDNIEEEEQEEETENE